MEATRAGVLIGDRYELGPLLRRGGMADVHAGLDRRLGRDVAIKLLRRDMAERDDVRLRFESEARAAARLSHPNAVSVFDTGEHEGQPYIVMERLPGRTLADVIAEGPVSVTWLVPVATGVLSALGAAHAVGIVHRDVKPGNILLCEDGRAKVADFGIAKALAGSDLTQTGMVLGTARYLSPEQVNGHALDGRSDVYALGVVLYEMLCGEAPFGGDSDMAIAVSRLHRDPPSVLERRPEVPPSLQVVVTRTLARSPDDRIASAGELRTALLAVPLHEIGARSDPDATVGIPSPRSPGQGGPWAPPRSEETPVAGVPVGPRHRRRRRSTRSVALSLAGLVLVAAGVVSAVELVGSRGGTHGGAHPGASTPAPGAGLGVKEVKAFDPPPKGDGQEHDADLAKLTDGNPSTVWSTEHYADRHFGGLKGGVGVALVLDGPHKLRRLAIKSPTHGWTAELYVATAPASDLGGWGQPVATATGIPGDTTVDLGNHQGGALLVWITDLGDGNGQVSIGELQVSA